MKAVIIAMSILFSAAATESSHASGCANGSCAIQPVRAAVRVAVRPVRSVRRVAERRPVRRTIGRVFVRRACR